MQHNAEINSQAIVFPTYNQQPEMQPIVINSLGLEKESLTMLYGSLKVC